MPGKRVRGGHADGAGAAQAGTGPYPALPLLLSSSLQSPACVANAGCCSDPVLLAMPQCKCTTVLASTYVNPTELPMPPDINNDDDSTSNTSAYLEKLLTSSVCSKTIPSRRPVVKTYKNLGMCKSCLEMWYTKSNDVQTYTYNDPNQTQQAFSIGVSCPQCKTKFTNRTIEQLLGKGRGAAAAVSSSCISSTNTQDEWAEGLRNTAQVLAWGAKVKKWVKTELMSQDASSDLSPDETELRKVLLSLVQDNGSGGGDDEDGKPAAHRQDTAPGELLSILMRRDPIFRQEKEDEKAAHAISEEIARQEEEERRREEADELMARKLQAAEEERKRAAGSSNGATSSVSPTGQMKYDEHDRADEEKKSEAAARALQEEWEKKEEEEKRKREERDAAFAREIYKKEQREERKRKVSSLLSNGSIRKSPFDSTSVVVSDHTSDNDDGDDGDDERKLPARESTGTSRLIPGDKNEVYEIDCSDDEGEPRLHTQEETSLQMHVRHSPSCSSSAPSASPHDKGAAFYYVSEEKESWGDKNERDLDTLEAMGFKREEARLRYNDAHRDVEKAASMLFSVMEERQKTMSQLS